MEIIDSLIFTQSLVWGAILLRKPSVRTAPLVLTFLLTGLIFLARYLEPEHDYNLLIQADTTVALSMIILFLNYNQGSKSSFRIRLIPLLLICISVLLLALTVFLSSGEEFYLGYLLGISLVITIFYIYRFIRNIRIKNYTGRWIENPATRLSFIVLISLSILITSGIFLLLRKLYIHDQNLAAFPIFSGIIAILMFFTGFTSIALVTLNESTPKPIKKVPGESGMMERIMNLMDKEKPYLDCELTLGKMAEMLDIDDHELTRVLNDEMDINFYGLVNKYRIDTVKEKLKEPSSRNFTIMASAYESGFNSKSTFYRIFKEYTGITPKDYLETLNSKH